MYELFGILRFQLNVNDRILPLEVNLSKKKKYIV